ncbi:hypothetical protein Tco_0601418 [Tanacetum coccineum]
MLGKFQFEDDKRKYVNGLVAYVDWCDIDKFSVHEIHGVMEKLGYVNGDPIYYHYLIPGTNLDMGLRRISSTPVATSISHTPPPHSTNLRVVVSKSWLSSELRDFDPFGCEQEET